MANDGPLLRITLVRSVIGGTQSQRATVKSLGLRRMHQTVERPDTAIVRGQIFKVQHLLKVEQA